MSAPESRAHHVVWNDKKVVRKYRRSRQLFPTETVVLARYGEQLRDMDVLDLGIGGGRTTHFLAGKCGSYLGTDFSPSMVEVCRTAYADRPNSSFSVLDARHLDSIADGVYDAVIFSYNGIDCLSIEDRGLAIKEIRRVLRPGGTFLFSSHNLNWLEGVMNATGFSLSSVLAKGRRALIKRYSPHLSELAEQSHAVANDGAHGGMDQVYIRPAVQIDQLLGAGFRDVEVFSAGGRTQTSQEAAANRDPWVHYFSTA
jgi:ubiquinone/menaquinone biosynthesis C-methylase UbiE